MSIESVILGCCIVSWIVNFQVLFHVTKLVDKFDALLLRARVIEELEAKQ